MIVLKNISNKYKKALFQGPVFSLVEVARIELASKQSSTRQRLQLVPSFRPEGFRRTGRSFGSILKFRKRRRINGVLYPLYFTQSMTKESERR